MENNMLLALVMGVYAMFASLWYKLGKVEQKVKDILQYVLNIHSKTDTNRKVRKRRRR